MSRPGGPNIADPLAGPWDAAKLAALAVAIGVQWPAWFPPFLLELAAPLPSFAGDAHWLAGGFVFASPQQARDETLAFRSGALFYTGAPSGDVAGVDWPQASFSHRFAVVGRTGEGAVLVDTQRGLPALLWLDKDGYFREPLIDFVSEGREPVGVASAMRAEAASQR